MDRSKYPDNWEEISHHIRFVRAKGKCEWPECGAEHLKPHPVTGSKVVLTTAHLENEDPMDCRYENLMAMCQKHHLAYDWARARKRLSA
jgi:hypothetical protein